MCCCTCTDHGQRKAVDRATPPLIRCSFSSDFHVLNPGRAHGEITLGYGLLDEDHPNGNLRPQTTIEELLDKLNRSDVY